MPSYEFRCNACRRKIVLTYKTYADYDTATHTCPRCGSTNLTRLISRVAIARSASSSLDSGAGDEDDLLGGLDENDPRTLGRMLREMGSEVGEDMGGEFEEVVERLERGESPEEIEATLPPLDTDMPGSVNDSLSGLAGDDIL